MIAAASFAGVTQAIPNRWTAAESFCHSDEILESKALLCWRSLDGVAVVEKASIDEAFIACCPPEGTDGQTAFAAGKALAERVKAAGAPSGDLLCRSTPLLCSRMHSSFLCEQSHRCVETAPLQGRSFSSMARIRALFLLVCVPSQSTYVVACPSTQSLLTLPFVERSAGGAGAAGVDRRGREQASGEAREPAWQARRPDRHVQTCADAYAAAQATCAKWVIETPKSYSRVKYLLQLLRCCSDRTRVHLLPCRRYEVATVLHAVAVISGEAAVRQLLEATQLRRLPGFGGKVAETLQQAGAQSVADIQVRHGGSL